jgi:hypothetical protein
MNNDKTYEVQFGSKIINKMLFTKYNYNDTVANIFKDIDSEWSDPDKNQWFKEGMDASEFNQLVADLKEILAYQNEKSTNPDQLTDKQKQALKKNRLLNIKKFKGFETLNGNPTMHYSLELNKAKLRTLMLENYADSNSYSELDSDQIAKLTDAIIDKIKIQNLDIWVGTYDHKVYKYDLAINMLSITKSIDKLYQSILKGDFDKTLNSARSKARDAKRISDVRQIMSALELYYDEHGRYPAAKSGLPTNLEDYIFDLPTAPTPADGSCNQTDNTYKYSIDNKGKTYKLTFCLGDSAGGTSAGKHTASEGMIDGYDDPRTDVMDQSDKELFDQALKIWKSLPFDATLTISYDVASYTADKEVWVPGGFKDRARYTDYSELMMSAKSIIEK